MSNSKQLDRLPSIHQPQLTFDQQFAQLSLEHCKEQRNLPQICKGMLSMIKPTNPQCTTKIKEANQLKEIMQCKSKCNSNKFPTMLLDLDVYKKDPCTIRDPHDWRQCPRYHGPYDQIRKGGYYKMEICPLIKQGQICPYGLGCCSAHNDMELYYQPDCYKTQFCPDTASCIYGMYCACAHSENEIRVELLHNYPRDNDFFMFLYKTIRCPFLYFQHDQVRCAYFHTSEDCRRNPSKFEYQVQECPIQVSNNVCPDSHKCQFSHNPYETYYHPMFYKTLQCSGERCNEDNIIDCPCAHGRDDQRVITPMLSSGCFKIVPKNRIIGNTFKQISKIEKLPPIQKK